MQRHQHDAGVVLGELVLVGDEAHGLQELVDRLVFAGHADELGQVLQPALGLQRSGRLELGGVASQFEDRFDFDRDISGQRTHADRGTRADAIFEVVDCGGRGLRL